VLGERGREDAADRFPGLQGRRLGDVPPGRVPPGQYVTRDFPCCRLARPRTRLWSGGTSPSAARWMSRVAGRGRSSARCRARRSPSISTV